MTRLPNEQGDEGVWGTLLLEYLRVAHNEDGTPKPFQDYDMIVDPSRATQGWDGVAQRPVWYTGEVWVYSDGTPLTVSEYEPIFYHLPTEWTLPGPLILSGEHLNQEIEIAYGATPVNPLDVSLLSEMEITVDISELTPGTYKLHVKVGDGDFEVLIESLTILEEEA